MEHWDLAQSMLRHVNREVELVVFTNRRLLEGNVEPGSPPVARTKTMTFNFCAKDGYFDRFIKNLHPTDQFKVFRALCAQFKAGDTRDQYHTLDYEFSGQLPITHLILIVAPNNNNK